MTLIKDRTNFGAYWVIDAEFDKNGDHIKKEHNKSWLRETISNEQKQIKYIFYSKKGVV